MAKTPQEKARSKAAAALFDDARAAFEASLPEATNPWHVGPPNFNVPGYVVDLDPLTHLVGVPVLQDAGSNTGRLGKMIDVWVSYEMRRAGFNPDAVWPRPVEPRVWPSDYTRLLGKALKTNHDAISDEIHRQGLATANVLGRHYFKQIDVLMASWDRGAELMVSTKAQMSSFGNNLNNRFEEFVGDAHNLRGRFPLAAMGLVYVVRSTILDEPSAYAKLVDMLHGLRDPKLYDATCLIIVDFDDATAGSWPDPLDLTGGWPRDEATAPSDHDDFVDHLDTARSAVIVNEHVDAAGLHPGPALKTLVEAVLGRSPVDQHVEARRRRSHPGGAPLPQAHHPYE